MQKYEILHKYQKKVEKSFVSIKKVRTFALAIEQQGTFASVEIP